MDRYYIGVDGGGTKTTAVLCNEEGNILGLSMSGGSNPGDMGVEAAAFNLSTALDNLPFTKSMAVTAYAGIAGILSFPSALNNFLQLFPKGTKTQIGSDATNVLECGLMGEDGCCVISGTGSVCFTCVDGKIQRIGGWGHLLDLGGSGYSIGRDCAESILRFHDGRDGYTMLAELYKSIFKCELWDDLPKLYTSGKANIASLAPLVFRAALEGDKQAQVILERSADALAEYINCASRIFQEDDRFKAILSGGVFQNGDIMMSLIKMRLKCNTELKKIPAPPVFGAASLAMSMDGKQADAIIQARFASDYNKIVNPK